MWKNSHVVILPTNKEAYCQGTFINGCIIAKRVQNSLYNTTPKNEINKLTLFKGLDYINKLNYEFQHLYITSNEEIKVNDWVILNYRIGKSIDKALPACLENAFHNADFWNAENKTQNLGNKPIIATTDTSLRRMDDGIVDIALGLEISYIPESFIKYFIEEYNKGNVITKVMVEYTDGKLLYKDRICSCGHVLSPMEESPHECCGSYKWEYKSVYDKPTLKINSDNTINIKPIKNSWNKEEVIEFAKLAFQTNASKSFSTGFKWIENNL